ncbi:zinc-finger domain-containing protein [Thermaurantiacus sp.]
MGSVCDISSPVPPPPETVEVRERRVWCDGGEGPLGHPRVYLAIDARGFVDCPYCDRRFVFVGDGAAAGH